MTRPHQLTVAYTWADPDNPGGAFAMLRCSDCDHEESVRVRDRAVLDATAEERSLVHNGEDAPPPKRSKLAWMKGEPKPHQLTVERLRWTGDLGPWGRYAYLRCEDCYHEETVLLYHEMPDEASYAEDHAATLADELAATRSAIHAAAPGRRRRRKSPERLERDKKIGAGILTGLVLFFAIGLYVDSQNESSYDYSRPADTGGSGVDCNRLQAWVADRSANGEFTASESDDWRGIVDACRD